MYGVFQIRTRDAGRQRGDAMKAYAVIECGGKQYRVQADDVVTVDRLAGDVGATIELKPVLAISDGATLTIGTPQVTTAKVTALIQNHIRGPKIFSFKKKRRKGYTRKKGHRQELTLLKIAAIQG